MARPIDLDQLMKYQLRRGSEHCDEKNADPRFLNGVESILEWAQTLPTLTPPNEWVSVEDRLPEPTYCVLVYTTDYSIEVDALDSDGEWMSYEVTHWMYLPVPPAKGGDR